MTLFQRPRDMPITVVMLWALIGGLGSLFLVDLAWARKFPAAEGPTWSEMEAACDRAVHALFTTTDTLELQRADLLVRHLDCNVRKRVPRAVDSP